MIALHTDAVLTAPEALDVVARAVGGTVRGSDVAFGGAEAWVEVSKFGDEVPVTIDVRHRAGAGPAAAAARSLAERLELAGWRVEVR